MTQVKTRTTKSQGKGRVGAIRPSSADARAPLRRALVADTRLEEVESVARIGSYSLDIASRRWVSSNGLNAIFGIDAAFERSLDDWASLVHPTDRAMMVAYLSDEVIGLRRPFDKQYRIVRPDTGEERWVHGRGALEPDETQFPLRLVGTIADITDQQRAREALAASELRYAAIFEGTTEAILIAELETKRFRWVNPAACALLGYTRGELLELTARDIHPAEGLDPAMD